MVFEGIRVDGFPKEIASFHADQGLFSSLVPPHSRNAAFSAGPRHPMGPFLKLWDWAMPARPQQPTEDARFPFWLHFPELGFV
jgi:hypothetical protein